MPNRWFGRVRSTRCHISGWTVSCICWACGIATSTGPNSAWVPRADGRRESCHLAHIALSQARKNLLSVELNHLPLVGLPGMNVYFCRAALECFLQGFYVNFGIGAHGEIFVNFLEREFRFSPPLNFLRITDIEIWLPRFRKEPPEFGRSFRILLVPDHHELLYKHRHLRRIFLGLARAALELLAMLFPGFRISNQAVSMQPNAAHCLRSVTCHQQRDFRFGWIVQSHVDVVILALMLDLLPTPELPNDVRGLDQALRTLSPLRPGAGRGLLIQRLAGTDPQENSSWIKNVKGCKRLSHYRRVVAECWAGDRRPHQDFFRSCADCRHGEPSLAGVRFIRLPGLQVIAVGNHVKSSLLKQYSKFHQFIDGKLLVRKLKTYETFWQQTLLCVVGHRTFSCRLSA